MKVQYRKDLIKAAIKPYKHILTIKDIDATIKRIQARIKQGEEYIHLCHNVPTNRRRDMRGMMDNLEIIVMEDKRPEWIVDYQWEEGAGDMLRIVFLQVWKDMLRNRKGKS